MNESEVLLDLLGWMEVFLRANRSKRRRRELWKEFSSLLKKYNLVLRVSGGCGFYFQIYEKDKFIEPALYSTKKFEEIGAFLRGVDYASKRKEY